MMLKSGNRPLMLTQDEYYGPQPYTTIFLKKLNKEISELTLICIWHVHSFTWQNDL